MISFGYDLAPDEKTEVLQNVLDPNVRINPYKKELNKYMAYRDFLRVYQMYYDHIVSNHIKVLPPILDSRGRDTGFYKGVTINIDKDLYYKYIINQFLYNMYIEDASYILNDDKYDYSDFFGDIFYRERLRNFSQKLIHGFTIKYLIDRDEKKDILTAIKNDDHVPDFHTIDKMEYYSDMNKAYNTISEMYYSVDGASSKVFEAMYASNRLGKFSESVKKYFRESKDPVYISTLAYTESYPFHSIFEREVPYDKFPNYIHVMQAIFDIIIHELYSNKESN